MLNAEQRRAERDPLGARCERVTAKKRGKKNLKKKKKGEEERRQEAAEGCPAPGGAAGRVGGTPGLAASQEGTPEED